MAAAKSLTPAELQTVLAYTSTQPYAQRNRAMLMMTVAAGLRVSEVAGLTLGDVLDSKGTVRGEVFLAAHRVKHQHARTIYINSRLQQELADYIATRTNKSPDLPLFPTHRGPRRHFSPNTLAQHFHWLYKRAGVSNASSHSGRKTIFKPVSRHRVFQCSCWLPSLGIRASLPPNGNVTVNDDVKTPCCCSWFDD